MASYKISFKKSVEKDLRQIDGKEVTKILSAINDLAEDPFPPASRKLVGSSHIYRLRVGDYRVLYFVTVNTKEIEIQRIRHRKEVYR